MPRTELTVTQMDFTDGQTVSGAEASADSANGMVFTNTSGDVFLFVANGDTSAKTLTVITGQTVTSATLTVQDPTYTIPAGDEVFIGPFPTTTFNQSDDTVQVDIDDDTSVTISAIQHGPTI